MITEFIIEEDDFGNPITFYAENFPIDLKIGDEIYLCDFWHLFRKGDYYCPDGEISKEFLEEFDFTSVEVKSLIYGFKNGKVVKMLTIDTF